MEADGAPGSVGRALVTVRNLGGGALPRPAWGCSLPGGSRVPGPSGFTPTGAARKGNRARQTPPSVAGAGGNEEEGEGGGGRGRGEGGRVKGKGEGKGKEEGKEERKKPKQRPRGSEAGGGLLLPLLPDNPLLEAFFPRGGRLHEALFYRVGGGGRGTEKTLPLNERVRGSPAHHLTRCCCCHW